MAARQDSCISHEGAEEGWHIHYDRMVTQQVFPLTKEGGLHNRSKPGESSVIMGYITGYPVKVLDEDEVSAFKFHQLVGKRLSAQTTTPTI